LKESSDGETRSRYNYASGRVEQLCKQYIAHILNPKYLKAMYAVK